MVFKHKGIGKNGRKSKPIKLFTDDYIDVELSDHQKENLNRRVRKNIQRKKAMDIVELFVARIEKKFHLYGNI